MLRKTLYGTVAAASLLLLSASSADAQFASPIRFNVHAGGALPVGNFGSTDIDGGGADLGFRVGAGLELRPPFLPVGLRLDGAFDRMGIEGADAAYSIWSVTANGVVQPMMSPLYFIGGIGFYSTDVTGDDADAVFGNFEAETDFGFNLGAGFSLPLTGFSTFIEGRWHRISVDENIFGYNNIDYFPIVFGIRF
ncbi:MAG: outer membrane beta-barrel protein [Gemmatimonadaceae bacterium]